MGLLPHLLPPRRVLTVAPLVLLLSSWLCVEWVGAMVEVARTEATANLKVATISAVVAMGVILLRVREPMAVINQMGDTVALKVATHQHRKVATVHQLLATVAPAATAEATHRIRRVELREDTAAATEEHVTSLIDDITTLSSNMSIAIYVICCVA